MTKTKIKNKFKFQKYLFFAIIPLLILTLLGLNVNNIGTLLDFNSIITNEGKPGEVVKIESKKGEFMVDVGSARYYSKKENGSNVLTLPKNNQEGNYEYKVSSFINLGFTKLRFNDKKVSVFKDFEPPTIASIFPRLVDTKEFSVNFKRDPKPFILTLNDKQVYDSSNNSETCSKTKDMEFDCKFKINSEQENINLVATDENGNTTVIYNGPVKYVEPLKLDCNQTKIEEEGIIECKTNRKIKYTIEVDNKKESKEGADIFIYKIENQENKKYPISVKVEDEQGLKQEYVKEVEVDKGVFDAKMWVVKSGDNPYNTVYNVYAWANKDADFEANLYETIHEYSYQTGVEKTYPGASGRAKIFARSDLPKDQEILVKTDKLVLTGCESICSEKNYEIKIYSTKNPDKNIIYSCKGGLGGTMLTSCNKK
jgi:hypothetical protein